MNTLDKQGNDLYDDAFNSYYDNGHGQPRPGWSEQDLDEAGWTQEDVDEVMRQYRLGHPAPGEEVNVQSKHVLEYWQDYLSLLVLLVTVVDYLCRSYICACYKNFGRPLRADELEPILPTHDEETGLPIKRSPKSRRRRVRLKGEKRGRDKFGLKVPEAAGCCGPRRRAPVKDNAKPTKPHTAAPAGVNMYDVAKVWAVLAMICDHWGYFGIPGPSYEAARWTRVVGRTAAPLFFFLSGFSSNYRFRWRTWCWCLFLFACNAWLRIRLTHTSWESLITILFINWLFAYIPLHRIKGWWWHLALFVGLYYSKDYMSNTLRWAYGSLPYEIAVAGMMVRNKHPLAKAWCAAAMLHYCSISVDVFSTGRYMTCWIVALVGLDTAVFMFFDKLVALGEFAFFDKTGPLKQLVLYFSRKALLIYVVHLMLFRLIQLLKWSWN